jgi:O-antigen/teichoic acid export membrane protein
MRTPLFSGLIDRSLVLATARASNYAILLFSPVVLTRVLDVEQFGQYREFILYAMVVTELLRFAVARSLTYFVPRYPERARLFVTQCVLFTLLSYGVALALLLAVAALPVPAPEFPYTFELLLYVFFFLNLDFVENYWLALGRSAPVLLYSCLRVVVRVGVVVAVAWLTADLELIIWSLIAVEAVRFAAVLVYMLHQRLLGGGISRATIAEQARFFVPLGLASMVNSLNKHLGKLFTAFYLGTVALAYYVVGSYMVPILAVLRNSVGDVIFPEMVRRKSATPGETLALWRRATVVYCFALFPVGVLLCLNAKAVVVFLFTEQYLPAVPVFQVFALMLMRDCFDMALPLRALNRNRIVLEASLLSLAINAVLIPPLALWLGLVGPAVALFVTRVIGGSYMTWRLLRLTAEPISELLPWSQVFGLALATMGAATLFGARMLVSWPPMLEVIVVGAAFGLAYLALARALHIGEVNRLLDRTMIAAKLRSARV